MPAIIEVRDLCKQYRIGVSRAVEETFREFLLRMLRKPRGSWTWSRTARRKPDGAETIWALRDVNFEVEEGEIVGIIGPNGAGKSTLLKILSRITEPTRGTICIRGRLSSLLEVGTGFHPELTGRENIFLNGATLGMRKAEIVSRFDEIVGFAEIDKFLDTPVKRYSSGMYVRLAFAVAAHLNPEILVVDEVLAVGDLAFQRKCLGKMSEVSQGGRTVLFVSHNMAAVEGLCRTGLVLRQGQLAFRGSVKEAIEYYLQSVSEHKLNRESHCVDLARAPSRPAKFRPLLKRLELLTGDGRPLNGGIPIGAPLRLRVIFDLESPTMTFDVILGFDTLFGQRILTASSVYDPTLGIDVRTGEQALTCEIPSLTLLPGEYKIKVHLNIGNTAADAVEDAAHLTIVSSDYYGTGKVPRYGTFVLAQKWRFG